MAYLLAILMAGLSYSINRLLVKYLGPRVIISFSPVVEEALKTLLPYILGLNILYNHLLFGVIEGVWEYMCYRYIGYKIFTMSVVGHGIIGGITLFVYNSNNNIWFGLLAGVISHWLWNYAAIRITQKAKR